MLQVNHLRRSADLHRSKTGLKLTCTEPLIDDWCTSEMPDCCCYCFVPSHSAASYWQACWAIVCMYVTVISTKRFIDAGVVIHRPLSLFRAMCSGLGGRTASECYSHSALSTLSRPQESVNSRAALAVLQRRVHPCGKIRTLRQYSICFYHYIKR